VIDCCIVFNECVERKKKSAPRSTEVEPHAGRRSPHVGVEPIPFNDIQLPGTILGYGSYGKVERAKWNHMDVVVRFCTEKGTTEEFRAAVRELMFVIYILLAHHQRDEVKFEADFFSWHIFAESCRHIRMSFKFMDSRSMNNKLLLF